MTSRFKEAFGADKDEATLLILFIPSVDRYGEKVAEQEQWVEKALEIRLPPEEPSNGE